MRSKIASCSPATTDLLSPWVSHSRIKEEETVSNGVEHMFPRNRIAGLLQRFGENDNRKLEKKLKRQKKLRKKEKQSAALRRTKA